MLDLTFTPEFFRFIYATGWSTLSSILFGATVICVYTIIRQEDRFFQGLHMLNNLSYYCFAAMFSVWVSIRNQHSWQNNDSSFEGIFFFFKEGVGGTYSFQMCLIIISVAFLLAASQVFHPPIYHKGIGIEPASKLLNISKKTFYGVFFFTTTLRNIALLFAICTFIETSHEFSMLDGLSSTYSEDDASNTPAYYRLYAVMMMLFMFALLFSALFCRQLFKATEGSYVNYRSIKLAILINNYERHATSIKPD